MKQTIVHLWFPNIFESRGGIQTYSGFMLEAIQNIFHDIRCEVFLKNDKNCLPDFPKLSATRFHFGATVPFFARTPVFAAQLISWGIWQRPQLIICGHLNFAIAAYLLKRLTGIPYWIVAHGIEAWDITNPNVKTALCHANLVLAVSQYTRERLLKEQNLDPHKVVVLANTFDARRFQALPKPDYLLKQYELSSAQPIILTVARLSLTEGYKGYDRVLQAIPQIRQSIPDVHYIIVGQGDDRARIEQLIEQLRLQDCVTLAGFVPDEQICDYYNLCDVFAMPSKGEGFGIVYLEALACGKPCLGGNRDGAIDALCHGELGALVNPDDVDAIALALIQILQKTYSNLLMFQPELLREKVINVYGFEQFQQTLAHLFN